MNNASVSFHKDRLLLPEFYFFDLHQYCLGGGGVLSKADCVGSRVFASFVLSEGKLIGV